VGLRILHLEDDPSDAELIELRLKEDGFPVEILWVQEREAFLEALKGGGVDLVLADYSLPGFSGLDALAIVKEAYPDLPFVFVSGSIGEERAIECLKLGARDYVLKERPSRLAPVIQRAVDEARIFLDRRKSRAELEAAARRQRVLLDATFAAGVVPWALQGDLLALGNSASHLLGHSAEALPQNLAELEAMVHPEDRALVRRSFEHVHKGVASIFECRLQRADGGYLWTRWTRHKHPGALGGIFQDIGEQHRLHEQLIQSQKMESLGALAGRIAHDFSNILQAIVGLSEGMAMKDDWPASQRKGLESIHRAGERGMTLIRQLRSFSRGEPLHRLPTNLDALAQEVAGLVSNTLGPNVHLEVNVGDLPTVMADSGQLHQILMNLIVNARDALQPTGGRIILRGGRNHLSDTQALVAPHASGDYVYLEVEDDGPGIPEDIRAHIFEPYFTTKGDKGTGLGLSVVCGIAEAHGGWLTCDSGMSRGTRFRLFLPLPDPPGSGGGGGEGQVGVGTPHRMPG
jgi:signal transduction histidine kinase